jgi:hypothetical protein
MDNIGMDLGDVGWGDVDWIGPAQDRRISYVSLRMEPT